MQRPIRSGRGIIGKKPDLGLFPEHPIWGIFAVLLFDSILHLIDLPFSYYDSMKIEEKYGFNRSTKKTFWADQVKSFIISMVLLTLIGMMIMGIHRLLGDWLILAMAVAFTLLILAFTFLYPLFVKLQYSHPTLSQRIEAIEKKRCISKNTKFAALYIGRGRKTKAFSS